MTSAYTLRSKKLRLKLVYDGAEHEVPCCWKHTFDDDETWQSAVNNQFPRLQHEQTLYFGDDYIYDLPNGFSDYAAPLPEGKLGVALTQHIMANLETRKIRVKHEGNAAKRRIVVASFSKFIDKAQKVLDDEVHKLLGEDSPSDSPAEALPQLWAAYHAFADVQKALFDARAEFRLAQNVNLPGLVMSSD